MKKYIFSFVCLCCALLPALEGQAHEYPNHPELRKSDANIVGHILDKNTKEHLPLYNSRLERYDYRNGNRCYWALFLEESSRRQFCARS